MSSNPLQNAIWMVKNDVWVAKTNVWILKNRKTLSNGYKGANIIPRKLSSPRSTIIQRHCTAARALAIIKQESRMLKPSITINVIWHKMNRIISMNSNATEKLIIAVHSRGQSVRIRKVRRSSNERKKRCSLRSLIVSMVTTTIKSVVMLSI